MPPTKTTYQSHADIWEDKATIRTRPRRHIEDDNLNYYPAERQPLCTHPCIVDQGAETINYVLLQSLYKYINDIIIFETEIVNKTARDIAKARFPFDFPFACRYDAMSVLIDEDYHAYVAMDYMNQVIERTGIVPIALPHYIELSAAIPTVVERLPEANRAGMELLAVAISENTVTADVAAFSRDLSVKRSVKGMMSDHLADEGRHSIFWSNLVQIYWREINEEARLAIGGSIPAFLERYLTNDLQQDFDRRLVASLALPPAIEAEIVESFEVSYPITSSHPMVGNIRNFLRRSRLLEHAPTRTALARFLD